jgi:predicted transcriptional regulator
MKAKILKEWRWDKRLTQVELAEILGCSQALLSQIENEGLTALHIQAQFIEIYGEEEAKKIHEFKLLKKGRK